MERLVLNGDVVALSGGGYFQGGTGLDQNSLSREALCLGGFYNYGLAKDGSHHSGTGGTAGKGGNVRYSQNCKIYAFNGNLYTNGTNYNDGLNQCPIYAQNGISVAKYDYVTLGTGDASVGYFKLSLNKAQSTIAKSGYENEIYTTNSTFSANKTLNINTKLGITTNALLTAVDMSKQGVGSGAGYIEVSNGAYTIDTSLN